MSNFTGITETPTSINVGVCNDTGKDTNILVAKFSPYQEIMRSSNFQGCESIPIPKTLLTSGITYWAYLRDAATDLTVDDPVNGIMSTSFAYPLPTTTTTTSTTTTTTSTTTPPPGAITGTGAIMIIALGGLAVAAIYLATRKGK